MWPPSYRQIPLWHSRCVVLDSETTLTEGEIDMIAVEMKRGFPESRFAKGVEPRVKRDDGGYYTYTLSENVKVYFDDFYSFLEQS